ncbi:pirin family protein [Dietzia timorensis]|uniref:Putative quercetin 2,3-dioxygenase n=1 Tax=Dietzia timorensis TaxID=499555 RepID=A0A173LJQ6_9ACTN|nr:pirin family protein [Dietzia timorensis]ANI91999.1 Putative quercetin 2,3-dioxygenase [Dietzia timorensis]
MSNVDTHPDEVRCHSDGETSDDAVRAEGAPVEIITAREVPLGGPRAMTVRRTLPQRKRSLIGAWCFVDHYGPDDVARSGGMDVAPHPHTGLQTVSWLFDGEIQHIDSGGNRGIVRPGEVNLMTSGAGICHSETSTPSTSTLHGVQLWVALPDSARDAAPRHFEHFVPGTTTFDGGEALVFLGELLGSQSPVETFTPLLGAEIRLDGRAEVTIDVNPVFEHGLLVDSGDIELEGVAVPVAAVGYTGIGARTLTLRNNADSPARLIFIGGEPFAEEIIMWWNFVGRTSEEIVEYRELWQARTDRFGVVDGYVGHGGPDANAQGMAWLPAPELPNTHLKPRKNPSPHARAESGGDAATKSTKKENE